MKIEINVDSKILRRTGYVVLGALAVSALVVPAVVFASNVTAPNTFINGQVADADEVNANFNAMATGVNDNDSRIITLEATVASLQTDVAILQSRNAAGTVKEFTTGVISNKTAEPFGFGVPGDGREVKAPYDGSIVAISIWTVDQHARTAGTLTIRPRVNGTGDATLEAALDATNPQRDFATVASGTITFSAGDLLSAEYDSTSDYATSLDFSQAEREEHVTQPSRSVSRRFRDLKWLA